jgi:hypothetical protein
LGAHVREHGQWVDNAIAVRQLQVGVDQQKDSLQCTVAAAIFIFLGTEPIGISIKNLCTTMDVVDAISETCFVNFASDCIPVKVVRSGGVMYCTCKT